MSENKNIYGQKVAEQSKIKSAEDQIKAGYRKIAEEYDDPAYKQNPPERVSDYVKRRLSAGEPVSPLELISAGYDEMRDRQEVEHLKRLARGGSAQAAERLKMMKNEKNDSKESRGGDE